MTVYVDPLANHGWIMYGRLIQSCHLFNDSVEIDELHELAQRIGLKRAWFQPKSSPHYDLTATRHQAVAIAAGAQEVDRHQAVAIWRARRHELFGPSA